MHPGVPTQNLNVVIDTGSIPGIDEIIQIELQQLAAAAATHLNNWTAMYWCACRSNHSGSLAR